jgi:hypothetical protein
MIAVRIFFYLIIALVTLFLVILLGGEGAWYFAWLLGTVMIVLISAAGGALFDTQDREEHANGEGDSAAPSAG